MADDNAQWAQDELTALRSQQPATMPTGSASDGTRPGWLGLLGEALGGGQAPGYRLRGREEDMAGSRALLNFGINMLLASGPSRVKPDLLSAAATGLQGAQQSLGEDQRKSQALAGQQYQIQADAQKQRLDRLRAAIPLIKLQEEMREQERVRNAPNPFAPAPTAAPATPAPVSGGTLPPPPDLTAVPLPGGGTVSVAAPHADRFQGLVADLAAEGYVIDPKQTGGYNRRYIAGTQTPSNHAFGTAIDVNWTKNPQGGAQGDIPPELARRLAAKHGLVWGGDWTGKTRDPMHFEVPRSAAGAPAAADVAPNAGNQFSGPGVPAGGSAQPPSPEVAGDVQAIVAGMTQPGGANPATLAPGQGRPVPGAQVAGPAAPQPDEDFDTFRRRNAPRPTPEQAAAFKSAPDAATLAQLDAAEQLAASQWPLAKTTAEQAQIKKEVAAIRLKRSEVIGAAADKGAAAQRAWEEAETRRLFDIWKDSNTANRTRQDKIDEETRKQRDAIELKRLEKDFDRDKEGARVTFDADKNRLTKSGEEANNKQMIGAQLRQVRAVLPGLPNGVIASVIGEYPQLTTILRHAGVVSPQQATDAQLIQGMTNFLATEIKPLGTGSLQVAEMNNFKTVLPSLLQTPEGRVKALAFLQNVNDRGVAEHEFAQTYFKRLDPATGKPAYNLDGLATAINKPRQEGGLGPVVPSVPRFTNPETAAVEAEKWLNDNVEIGHPFMGWGYPLDKNSGKPLMINPQTGKKNSLVPQLMVREN